MQELGLYEDTSLDFYEEIRTNLCKISDNYFPFPVVLIKLRMPDNACAVYTYILDKLKSSLMGFAQLTEIPVLNINVSNISKELKGVPMNTEDVIQAIKLLTNKYNLIYIADSIGYNYSIIVKDYNSVLAKKGGEADG